MRFTSHGKKRLIERDDNIESVIEAKRVAKQAFISGKPISDYRAYPDFFNYLKKKKNQCCDCSLRVYRNNIYIWKTRKHILVTVHPIPDRFQEGVSMLCLK